MLKEDTENLGRTATAGTQAGTTAGTTAEADATRRATRLEALLGDPYAEDNPHGLRSLFAADTHRTPPQETEHLLTEAGLNAEFVPAEYGGRLVRADLLAQVLRPVFRRDVTLGFGYGIISLFAASAVWAAGSRDQREVLARLLLDGGRATILHHELAHANAILRQEFTARAAPDGGYLLAGRKDVIINARRSDVHVVYARTDPARGPRSHSVLLVEPGRVPPGTVLELPRAQTSGMRGALFSGLEFIDSPVPADALVGRPGEGVALALRTFQVNRSLICGVVTASADTVLRSAVRAVSREAAGVPARRWHRPLAGVFADLLACDAMATAVLRALSLLPDRAHVCAAAVKYVVPDLLRDDLEELATVLGGRGYAHDSAEYGALDKLMRDLPVAGLGHAGTASCQSVIVPQLRALAERSWFAEPEPPRGLFGDGAGLPPLDHRLLGIAGGGDFMAASLVASARRLAGRRDGAGVRALAGLAEGFVGELRTLAAACRRLPDYGASALADPAVCGLSDRYCVVVGAAAVLGVWEAAQGGADPFLADPAWALLALSRLGRRLGTVEVRLPDGTQESVLEELVARYRAGRGFDLGGRELAP